MDLSAVNYLAVFVAAVSMFLIGAVWYSKFIFGKAWMKVNNFTEEDNNQDNVGRTFGLAFVFSFIMALNLAFFLADESTTLAWGIIAGALAGVGWVALGFAMIALFEKRSWKYILINGGYIIFSFIAMGAILGAWR